MSLVIRVTLLTILWLLAWGEASITLVVTGVAVSALLLVAFPPARTLTSRVRFRPIALLRLFLYVGGQLVTSNVLVAREILSRRSRVHTGVLAHRLRHPSDELLTLVANVIALTPGTMTVEATRSPAVIYVHFLLLDDVDEARRAITRLEELAFAALGRPTSTGELP
jgi:multicomponent Na+:H+ antiporter subunit E